MNLPAQYGPRIKQLRLAHNEVQAELASALSVSRSHITNIENGKDAASLETLIAIAGRYNVSLDWLIRGVGDMAGESLSVQERALVALYRELPTQARENALKLFQVAANIAGMEQEGSSPAQG